MEAAKKEAGYMDASIQVTYFPGSYDKILVDL